MSASNTADDGIPLKKEELVDLAHSLRRPRTLINFILTGIVTALTLTALFPLFSVLYMLIVRGGRLLSLSLFTELPPTAFQTGGGFGNAVIGTLLTVGIAALLSIPFGILASVFLAEISPDSRIAQAVRFTAKVLTGFPSILAGVFAYGSVVLLTGGYSAFAGGVALSILMLPIVMLTAEEAIRMVPAKMREAAIGMGATQTQVVWKILLPTAMPGILTGVMLSVARAAGETAPLLFTALFSNYWPWTNPDHALMFWKDDGLKLMQPTSSLAVFIYNFSSKPAESQVEMAWAAALVLVMIVLVLNLIGQSLARKKTV
jgi:phosphate transport system permease protein